MIQVPYGWQPAACYCLPHRTSQLFQNQDSADLQIRLDIVSFITLPVPETEGSVMWLRHWRQPCAPWVPLPSLHPWQLRLRSRAFFVNTYNFVKRTPSVAAHAIRSLSKTPWWKMWNMLKLLWMYYWAPAWWVWPASANHILIVFSDLSDQVDSSISWSQGSQNHCGLDNLPTDTLTSLVDFRIQCQKLQVVTYSSYGQTPLYLS